MYTVGTLYCHIGNLSLTPHTYSSARKLVKLESVQLLLNNHTVCTDIIVVFRFAVLPILNGKLGKKCSRTESSPHLLVKGSDSVRHSQAADSLSENWV